MNSQTRNAKTQVGAGPQRGSFPLDHLHECDVTIEKYFVCMKTNKYFPQKCREEMRSYLDCRLDKNLMTKDDYRAANLPDPNAPIREIDLETISNYKRAQRRKDHVAGVGKTGINWDGYGKN